MVAARDLLWQTCEAAARGTYVGGEPCVITSFSHLEM